MINALDVQSLNIEKKKVMELNMKNMVRVYLVECIQLLILLTLKLLKNVKIVNTLKKLILNNGENE